MDWEKMLKGESKGHRSHCSCDHKEKKHDDHKKHDDSEKKWHDHKESKCKTFFENIAFGTLVTVRLEGNSAPVTARFVGIHGSIVTLAVYNNPVPPVTTGTTTFTKIYCKDISAVSVTV
ncbi:hypothetical protein ACI2JA_20000 [Alkalihalobacillus sp. NPDC078783]